MFDRKRFVPFAWGVLIYNIGVILWGAYVRATGSGAGCGSHWPLCNGEVIPRAEQIETLIEFAHRATSGLALILVVLLLWWAFRAFPKGHPVRLGAILSAIFIFMEAAIGASLVLFELVADNASLARAISISLHLVNTFLLLGSLTLTARWATTGRSFQLRDQGAVLWLLVVGFMGTIAVGMSGALTALGDTLFPSASLAEGLQQDLSPISHFLIRLRLLHPVLAVSVAAYWLILCGVIAFLRQGPKLRRYSQTLTLLILVQSGIGLLNMALLAPIWIQLIHLLMADVIWITLVLFASSVLESKGSIAEKPALEIS